MTDISILKNAGNQIFSFSRFYKYLLLYLKSNNRTMMLILGSLVVCMSVLFVFLGSQTIYGSAYYAGLKGDPVWTDETQCAIFAFFAAMTLFGNQMYHQISNRRTRLYTIEAPASNLEKVASYFLIWGIMMPFLFFLCVWLADIVRVLYISIIEPGADKLAVINITDLFSFGSNMNEHSKINSAAQGVIMLYSAGYFCEAFFALCGLIFSKNTYMKTAIAGFVLYWIIFFIGFLATYIVFGMDFRTDQAFQEAVFSGANMFLVSGGILFDLFLFWLAYRRFCESEIIFRW